MNAINQRIYELSLKKPDDTIDNNDDTKDNNGVSNSKEIKLMPASEEEDLNGESLEKNAEENSVDISAYSLPLISVDSLPLISVQSLPLGI